MGFMAGLNRLRIKHGQCHAGKLIENINIIEGSKFYSKIVDEIEKDITKNLIGIDNIKGGNGSLAMPRKQEILCAINRLRTLKIKK